MHINVAAALAGAGSLDATTPPLDATFEDAVADWGVPLAGGSVGAEGASSESMGRANSSSAGLEVSSEHGRMTGLFLLPCTVTEDDGAGHVVSHMDVREWQHAGAHSRYVVDRTFFRGDRHCRPALSRIESRAILAGEARWRGESAAAPGASRAQLHFTNGSIFLSESSASQETVSVLNEFCHCGGVWTANTWRTITAPLCRASLAPGAPLLCKVSE